MRVAMSFLSAAFLSLVPIFLSAQEGNGRETYCIPVKNLHPDSLAFDEGEHLRFTMHYVWGTINSDVGWATVNLDRQSFNGIPAFHCKVYGQTTRIFDLFFKVREDFQSWFSCDSLVPLRFTRNTQEGRYIAKNDYIYYWEGKDSHIKANVYSSKKGERSIEIPLTKCTFDLPALFFFARNMDFSKVRPGIRYPMTFSIDDDVYDVYFIMYGREIKDIKGLGKVRTVKFAAKLLAGGVFTGEEDMMIWISDDDNRLPVYFEAPILVGTASGRLESYTGLKHPFSSLIMERK